MSILKDFAKIMLSISLIIIASCTPKQTDFKVAAVEVQAAYEEYRQAVEAEDATAVGETFATDKSTRIFFGDGLGSRGVAAIVDAYRSWFATDDSIHLAPKDVIVQVSPSGDAAWMTYLEDGSVISQGKRQTWKDRRSTLVFSKSTSGWHIVHGHWSDAPSIVDPTKPR